MALIKIFKILISLLLCCNGFVGYVVMVML